MVGDLNLGLSDTKDLTLYFCVYVCKCVCLCEFGQKKEKFTACEPFFKDLDPRK